MSIVTTSTTNKLYIYIYVSWISMFMLLELHEPCLLVASLFKLKLVVPGGVPSAS